MIAAIGVIPWKVTYTIVFKPILGDYYPPFILPPESIPPPALMLKLSRIAVAKPTAAHRGNIGAGPLKVEAVMNVSILWRMVMLLAPRPGGKP